METFVEKGANVKPFVRYNSRNDWGILENIPLDIKDNLDMTTGDIIDFGIVKKRTKTLSTKRTLIVALYK